MKLVGQTVANWDVETREFGDGDGIWLGRADVKDAFHRQGMPGYLSRCFGY